jgi:hypothetical protein
MAVGIAITTAETKWRRGPEFRRPVRGTRYAGRAVSRRRSEQTSKATFMRIGFITPPVPGHLNPMTTLARHLQSRGHDVVYIGLTLAGPAVRAAHLPFVPCAEKEFTDEQNKSLLLQLSKLHGAEAREFTIGVLGAVTEAMLNSLPTILPAEVDALVPFPTSALTRLLECPLMYLLWLVTGQSGNIENPNLSSYSGRTDSCRQTRSGYASADIPRLSQSQQNRATRWLRPRSPHR